MQVASLVSVVYREKEDGRSAYPSSLSEQRASISSSLISLNTSGKTTSDRGGLSR